MALKGRLQDAVEFFKCAVHSGNHMVLVIGVRPKVGDIYLECVDEFCYLGDLAGLEVVLKLA